MAFRRSSGFKKMIFGLLALLFGGGTGLWGWFNPDTPIVGTILQKLRTAVPGDPAAPSPLLSIMPHRDPFVTAGVFECTIAKVTLDPADLRQGHHVDLQVKVSKKFPNGQDQLVWDSRYAGERVSLVNREPITATWTDKPFQVAWQPGEEFIIEVWDRKALFDKTLFLLETTNGEREFPLRPDTTTFSHWANGKRTTNAAANTIRVEAKRAGDLK